MESNLHGVRYCYLAQFTVAVAKSLALGRAVECITLQPRADIYAGGLFGRCTSTEE